MGTLIDTSVLVAVERGVLDFSEVLAKHAGEDVAISVITASELLHGFHRARGAARDRRGTFVESLLERLPVLPFDLPAARVHAEVWAGLASRGTAIAERDLIVAATALAVGYEVATRDRGFSKIPGLSVEIW